VILFSKFLFDEGNEVRTYNALKKYAMSKSEVMNNIKSKLLSMMKNMKYSVDDTNLITKYFVDIFSGCLEFNSSQRMDIIKILDILNIIEFICSKYNKNKWFYVYNEL